MGRGLLAHDGRMPGQWVAVVNRTFCLAPPEHPPAPNWDKLTKGGRLSPTAIETVPDAFFGPGRRDAAAYVLHRDGLRLVGSAGTWGVPSFGLLSLDKLCHRVSAHPQVGLFSVVSQISPTRAANWEDLSLLDPTDPKQALLLVIEQVDDDFFIYRRLYREEP